MTGHIAIIDYGSGNLRSAAKAFEKVISQENLDLDVLITSRPEDVESAEKIVLPGQGAFGDCITALKACPGMIEAMENAVRRRGVPFLGICVGMQLLATRGLENGIFPGLNWIPGEVVKLDPANDGKNNAPLKIPHMGWNGIMYHLSDAGPQDNRHPVFRHNESGAHFYFVHSYHYRPHDIGTVAAVTEYGGPVVAAVAYENICGLQFHPEKSQQAGLQLIADFLSWRP